MGHQSAEPLGAAQRCAVRIAIATLIALSIRGAAEAAPGPASQYVAEVTEIDAVGDPTAPALPAKTLQSDTVWIADWTFDNPAGGCATTGWFAYDFRILNDGQNYWVVDNRFDGLGGVISGRAAIVSHHDLCWARDGYNNNADFSIVCKYQDPPGAMTFATIAFDMHSDTEPNFDFVTIEGDSAGASEALAANVICTNPKGNPETFRDYVVGGFSGNLPPAHFGPINLPEYGTGIHEVYIHFEADGGYSDEDGLYRTENNAALVVDNIVVTGPLAYSENFEAALSPNVALVNSAPSAPYCTAPWARLYEHITDNDKCTENFTCAWLQTDPLRPAFFPNMAFGPGGAVVRNWLDDIFVGPWVSLASTPGDHRTVLSFRRFPGSSFNQGRIVQGWRVRGKVKVDNTDTSAAGDSIDCVTAWGHASSFNSLNSWAWITSIFDMTPDFDPRSTEIQLSFRVTDWQFITAAPPPAVLNTGPGPYTDRIRIGRRAVTGPVISEGADSRSQAQDAFPTVQNAIGPGEHFSPDGGNRFGTCAFSTGADLGINGCCVNLITGDSIWIDAMDTRGAGGISSVKLYAAITAGPHAGKAPAPYTVGANGFFEIQADSARAASGAVVANQWFVDLDDTYFRGGDQLKYFWGATDHGMGFASMPSGLAGVPVSVTAAEAATNGLHEVNFLPSITWDPTFLAAIAADAHGDIDPTPAQIAAATQNCCFLYVQKSNPRRRSGPTQRTSFMYTLDRLGYEIYRDYDVYDVQGYGNTNNALGSRANVAQASGYSLIIQDDGRSQLVPNIPDGSSHYTEKVNQAQWYRDYLAQGVFGLAGSATFWLIGESTPTGDNHAANPLYTTDMGLAMLTANQGLAVNPDVLGVAGFTFASGIPIVFTGDEFTLQGGCPTLRNYDAASAAGTAVVTHSYRSGTTIGPGAIVMNKNAFLQWNTVWMGFGWFDIREKPISGQADLVLVSKLLGGLLPINCPRAEPVPSPLPEPDAVPAVSALHPNVPNPFNPITEIRFDLAREGPVTLGVYDVTGRLVRTLVDEMRAAGRYEATWNGLDDAGRAISSGVYFYRLQAPGFVATRKMVAMK